MTRGRRLAPHYRLAIPPGERTILRLPAGRRVAAGAVRSGVRRDRRRAPARGGRVLRDRDPGPPRRGRAERHAPGAGGAALVEAVVPLRRPALARGRSRPARRRPRSASAGATPSGRISTTATSISMPDKWEYPWYAAWDLAFHTIPLALVDPDFAKDQLVLFLREWYMHPNGQIPAYEWAFGDVNPPVHAWAAWRVYKIERRIRGRADRRFLERVFQKLLLNFTWWVNRKDPDGQERLPGRLPRARQHRRVRPLGAAAHRRPPRAVRRHGVDGDVLPQHARDRARARRGQPRLRGHGLEVLRALRVHRPRDERHGRRGRRALERGGRLLLRRAPACPTDRSCR